MRPGITLEEQCSCTQPRSPAHTDAHLCVAPGALLNQAPGHGAAHWEALEDASDEVTEAKGHQLLVEVGVGDAGMRTSISTQ